MAYSCLAEILLEIHYYMVHIFEAWTVPSFDLNSLFPAEQTRRCKGSPAPNCHRHSAPAVRNGLPQKNGSKCRPWPSTRTREHRRMVPVCVLPFCSSGQWKARFGGAWNGYYWGFSREKRLLQDSILLVTRSFNWRTRDAGKWESRMTQSISYRQWETHEKVSFTAWP